MYLEFYGLCEKPFNITPNPRFVFLSKNHREVFAHLLYGIQSHAGFIEVTGEVGTGKTTVLRTLFAELENDNCRIAYIFNPCLSALELLRAISREFGLPVNTSPADLHADLNAFLLSENAAGRTVVLVIDEAQNLEPSVLEQIRLLSNLETETEKLIQIVLVGQPELGILLNRPELRQLTQRITVRYHLQSMDQEDTASYIQRRLSVAGRTGSQLFSDDAVRWIYRKTRGNPRLINILCDRALLVGYAESSERIDGTVVRVAARELRRDCGGFFQRWRMAWLTVVVSATLLLGLWLVGKHGTSSTAQSNREVKQSEALSNVVVRELLSRSSLQSATDAIEAIMKKWGINFQPVFPAQNIALLWEDARNRGFEIARVSGDLLAMQRLDLPVILELDIDNERRYAALLGVVDNKPVISFSASVESESDWSHFAPYWSGHAYLLWRNPLNLPVSKTALRESDQIHKLQILLNQTGSVVPRSGRYDKATTDSIRIFQKSRGLMQNGVADLQTLVGLYIESGRYGYPSSVTQLNGGGR